MQTPTTPRNPTPTTPDRQRKRWRGWRDAQGRGHSANVKIQRPVALLAVDPGSRRTGFAVFEGTELVHGGVKDFGFQRATATVLRGTRRLIEDQIRYFDPEVLVVERTFAGYRNKDISKLLAVAEVVRAVAREHSLPIVEYAPRTARLIVVGDGNATKRHVAEAVCLRYPEYQIHLEQTHLWKETYWSNFFDAGCVGLAYLVEKRLSAPLAQAQPTTPGAIGRRPGS